MGGANWVDLIVVVGVVLVAIAGWRAGVVTTAAAFAGFIGGALLGAWFVPKLLVNTDWPALVKTMATLGAMLVLGMVGQAILGAAGRAIRDSVALRPIRLLDSASGMVVSAIAFLLSAWLLLSVTAQLPAGSPADQVRTSRSYPILERVLAGPGGALIDDARALLSTLQLPSLPFNPATLPPVAESSDVEISDEAVDSAKASVVRIAATSSRCSTSMVGSGLVVAPEHVVTNAHVVTGAGRITVQLSGGRTHGARLVSIDPATDVAVLYVPGLDGTATTWNASPERGDQGAIAGYPGGGRLKLRGAVVRGTATIPAESGGGMRDVVVVQGLVQPGNSGGALLDQSGRAMGLIFANSSVDDRTGFALSPSEVRPVVDKAIDETDEVDSGACAVPVG